MIILTIVAIIVIALFIWIIPGAWETLGILFLLGIVYLCYKLTRAVIYLIKNFDEKIVILIICIVIFFIALVVIYHRALYNYLLG